MDLQLLEDYSARSRALDLTGIDWAAVARHPLPPGARRVLRYMQDIESHTIVYLRELLATRAIDDPRVAEFLSCWNYEEAAHGRALRRFIEATGESIIARPRSQISFAQRVQEKLIAMLSRRWRDFVAVHMTWGAINELTTLSGYRRLAILAQHPVLTELVDRIARDESRHFAFYFHQAKTWLVRPRVAPIVRALVERFWAPVGSGVQPPAETRFLATYLFSGEDGRAAARKVDRTIQALPGLGEVGLLEHWLRRASSRSRARARNPYS